MSSLGLGIDFAPRNPALDRLGARKKRPQEASEHDVSAIFSPVSLPLARQISEGSQTEARNERQARTHGESARKAAQAESWRHYDDVSDEDSDGEDPDGRSEQYGGSEHAASILDSYSSTDLPNHLQPFAPTVYTSPPLSRVSPGSAVHSLASDSTLPGSAGSLFMRRLMTAQERLEEKSHALRQAQSMGDLYGGYIGAGMVVAAMRDHHGPPSLDLLRAQHIALQGAMRQAPSPSASVDSKANSGGPPSPSRLPAFLQQRQQAAREALASPTKTFPMPPSAAAAATGAPLPATFELHLPMARLRSAVRTLERPKSMLELSQVYGSLENQASRKRLDTLATPGSADMSSRSYRQLASSSRTDRSALDTASLRRDATEGRAESARRLTRSAGLRKSKSQGTLGRSFGAIEGHMLLRPNQNPTAPIESRTDAGPAGPPRPSSAVGPASMKMRGRSLSEGNTLARQSTLLSSGTNPSHHARELSRLLAPTSNEAKASSAASTKASLSNAAKVVALEGAKPASKARVDMDLVLESSLVVEGGSLKGRMEIKVAAGDKKHGDVWMAEPKIRVVGFEELHSVSSRHIFFHHAVVVDHVENSNGSVTPLPCFGSPPDEEGFHKGVPGAHAFPFRMRIPIGKGAKGVWKNKQGAVRYIVIGSVKLKSYSGQDRSIAHFYRHVEVYPFYNPAVVLASALRPIEVSASKSLFLGGNGRVYLTATMHRPSWIAGQRCYVDVHVKNEASKKVKALTLTLLRATSIIRPRSGDAEDPAFDDFEGSACQTQTTKKKVAEEVLEVGKKGHKGGVTAKGLWMGVEHGEEVAFSHFLLVPPDALSVPRGRHVEVSYALRVSVGASLSDVSVELPIRVLNFVSLDPPPGHTTAGPLDAGPASQLSRCWSIDEMRPPTSSSQKDHGITAAAQIASSVPGANAKGRPVSLDSLRLSDLTGLSSAPTMSRGTSYETSSRSATASSPSAAPLPANSEIVFPHRGTGDIVAVARGRQLKHQSSLDVLDAALEQSSTRRALLPRGTSHLRHAIQDSSDDTDGEEDQARAPDSEDEEMALPASPTRSIADAAYYARRATGVDNHAEDEVSIPGVGSGRLRRDDTGADYDSDEEIASMLQKSPFSELDAEGVILPGAFSLSPRSGNGSTSAPPRATRTLSPRVPPASSRAAPVGPSQLPTPIGTRKVSRPLPVPTRAAAGRSPRLPAGASSTGVRSPVIQVTPTDTPSRRIRPQTSRNALNRASPQARNETEGLHIGSARMRVASTARSNTGAPVTVTRRITSHTASIIPAALSPPELETDYSSSSSPSSLEQILTPTTDGDEEDTTVVIAAPSVNKSFGETIESTIRPRKDCLGSLQMPPPGKISPSKASVVLPSVRSKIAALESREQALKTFASSGDLAGKADGAAAQLARQDSFSEACPATSTVFGVSRMASIASFRAPLLKKK